MANGVVGIPHTIDEAVAMLRSAANSKQSYAPHTTGNNRASVNNKAFAGIIAGGGAGGSNFLLQTKKAYISS